MQKNNYINLIKSLKINKKSNYENMKSIILDPVLFRYKNKDLRIVRNN